MAKLKAVEIAASFAALAEHYRNLGDAEVETFSFYKYCLGKDELVSNARALPKPLRKEVSGDEYRVIFELPGIYLQVYAPRDRVCTVIRPAIEAEYECEPLLSIQEEEAAL